MCPSHMRTNSRGVTCRPFASESTSVFAGLISTDGSSSIVIDVRLSDLRPLGATALAATRRMESAEGVSLLHRGEAPGGASTSQEAGGRCRLGVAFAPCHGNGSAPYLSGYSGTGLNYHRA